MDLQSVPLFQNLSVEQVQELKDNSQTLSFDKAQTIFGQGDPGKGFYILLTGRVKVFKLSLEGKEQILHIFGPGEPIGEVPVFAGETFPAHAQALEASSLRFFPRERLIKLFQQDPLLAMNMLAVLSRRLRQFTQLIEDLSLRELPSRLAAYLVHLQDASDGQEQISLDVTKGTLANILGTTQETLSRTLRRMADTGIISMDRRTITILSDGRLEDLAEGYESLSE